MPIFKKKIDVMGFVNPETGENQEFNKPYLLIIKELGDDEGGGLEDEVGDDYQEFTGTVGLRGRRVVFDYLCQRLGSFDMIHSYVLSGNIPLGKEVSIYSFIRLCVTNYFAQSNNGLTLEELEGLAYQTSNVDPEKFDLDVLFQRECG